MCKNNKMYFFFFSVFSKEWVRRTPGEVRGEVEGGEEVGVDGEEPGEVVDGEGKEVGVADHGEEDQQHQDKEEALEVVLVEEDQEVQPLPLREVSCV